jgi:hypothetical protein
VTTTTPALAEVFQGYDSWSHAVAADRIRVDGPPTLVRSFPRWFLWSPFADAARTRAARS